MRVGIGYDIHTLKSGRRLVLGGIRVPHSKGLSGHSDGDALLHAIVDAILGAAGEGDIGDFFPDKDPRYLNARSSLFVEKTNSLLKKKRLRVAHIDTVIVAEAPQLTGFKMKMRKNIAGAFGINLSSVGVKAKTNEGYGAIGKKRAIACHAVVSLVSTEKT